MTRRNNFICGSRNRIRIVPGAARRAIFVLTQICQIINCASLREAIKSFVAKCGVDVDRVYAVGFAGTRRLSDDITEEKGAVNRRVEVHMMPYAPPGRL